MNMDSYSSAINAPAEHSTQQFQDFLNAVHKNNDPELQQGVATKKKKKMNKSNNNNNNNNNDGRGVQMQYVNQLNPIKPNSRKLSKPSSIIPEGNDLIQRQGNTILSPKYQNVSPKDRQSKTTYSRKNILGKYLYTEENLGENFDESPWLPPSIEKAKDYKAETVYRGGDSPLSLVRVVDAPDLSIGVQMYFQFLKSIGICFFIMSLLSIPCLVFVRAGSKILEKDRDLTGLYRYTLGNIGYDPTSASYLTDSACTSTAGVASNSTCIHFEGHELTLQRASYVITSMELCQMLVFFLTALYLKRRLYRLRATEIQECSISDYAISVKGLPENTTVADLVEHFSSLYPLDKPDWKGRPGVKGCRTVDNISNTGNPIYLNTWVAECILHKKIGGFLSAFKYREDLRNKLTRNRALMKMYSENTPHAYGPNLAKYKQAEKQMLQYSIQVESVVKQQMKQNQIKFHTTNVSGIKSSKLDGKADLLEDGSLKAAVSKAFNSKQSTQTTTNIASNEVNIEDPQSMIDAEVVAAFITFEYTESMARCVEDYSRYSRFPWSLIYPRDLKFRGRQLKVTQAPDPEEIAWENLEISSRTKFLYRSRNLILAILLSIAAFVVILQSNIYRDQFASDIPSNTLCGSTIPNLYRNTTTTTQVSSLTLVRPPSLSSQESLDRQCDSIIKGSFYAIYGIDGDFNSPVSKYSFSACSVSPTNICPTYGQSTAYCPCITTSSSQTCEAVSQCSSTDSSKCKSSSFQASFIGFCYCKQTLIEILLTARSDIFNKLKQQSNSPTCSSFFINYSTSTALFYTAIIVTLIINKVMITILTHLTRSESYNSLGKFNGQLMLKIFLLTFINLTLLQIFASGKATHLPTVLKDLHIFDGLYTDLSPGWYGNVGTYFLTSYILQAIFPIISKLTDYYILAPLMKWFLYPAVRSLKSQWVVKQAELNSIEVGPVFDTTLSISSLLALLFFAMTFGSGLPLMMPMTCIVFICHFSIDKLLLCRYNQRPPHIDEYAIRIAIDWLPFAALIRVAVGSWMYSNTDVFDTQFNNPADTNPTYTNFLESLQESWSTSIPGLSLIARRMTKQNAFPLFAVFIIVCFYHICNYIWSKLNINQLRGLIGYYCCNQNVIKLKSNGIDDMIHPYDIHIKKDKKRSETAPFSKEFHKFVKNVNEIPSTCYQILTDSSYIDLSEDDKDNGWLLIDKDGYIMKVLPSLHRLNNLETHPIVAGAKRLTSSFLPGEGYVYTYEFISEHGTNSYSLSKIPAYKSAITALTESAWSIIEDHENSKDIIQDNGEKNNTTTNKRESSNDSKNDLESGVADMASEIAKLKGSTQNNQTISNLSTGSKIQKNSDKEFVAVDMASEIARLKGIVSTGPDNQKNKGSEFVEVDMASEIAKLKATLANQSKI